MADAIPAPSSEIERLQKVVDGTWSMKVTYAPNPLMPEGGEAAGSEESSHGPGDFSVVINSTSNGPGDFAFKALGVITWDATEEAYKLYWFNSLSPVAALFDGKWEGEDLNFVGTEIIMGQTMSSRHKLTNIKPDSFDYAIDMGPNPDQLARTITIHYTRT